MGYTVMENGSDFDRGVVAERLREHDRRLEKINGSVDRMADKSEDMATEMQRLRGELTAVRKSVEDAADAVRTATERRWAPLTRAGIIAAILAAAATIAGIAIALAHR
jgi:Mg2+ and Co2+ transporter CorA